MPCHCTAQQYAHTTCQHISAKLNICAHAVCCACVHVLCAVQYAPLQEIALQNGLADCYEQGLVRAVGVSNYGPKQMLKIYKNLEKRGVPLASAQVSDGRTLHKCQLCCYSASS